MAEPVASSLVNVDTPPKRSCYPELQQELTLGELTSGHPPNVDTHPPNVDTHAGALATLSPAGTHLGTGNRSSDNRDSDFRAPPSKRSRPHPCSPAPFLPLTVAIARSSLPSQGGRSQG